MFYKYWMAEGGKCHHSAREIQIQTSSLHHSVPKIRWAVKATKSTTETIEVDDCADWGGRRYGVGCGGGGRQHGARGWRRCWGGTRWVQHFYVIVHSFLLCSPSAPTKVYDILVVLDPTRRRDKAPDAKFSATDWLAEKFKDGAEMLANSVLRSHVLPNKKSKPQNPDYVAVWLHEMVGTGLHLITSGDSDPLQLFMTWWWKSHQWLKIRYMSWEDFWDAVGTLDENRMCFPASLQNVDLIWGGANFTLDIRYGCHHMFVMLADPGIQRRTIWSQ